MTHFTDFTPSVLFRLPQDKNTQKQRLSKKYFKTKKLPKTPKMSAMIRSMTDAEIEKEITEIKNKIALLEKDGNAYLSNCKTKYEEMDQTKNHIKKAVYNKRRELARCLNETCQIVQYKHSSNVTRTHPEHSCNIVGT